MPGTLVAADLIRAGRDQHPTFDDRRHPDPVLLRALSRYQRELLARIIALDPSEAVTHLDTALPLADFHAGIAVPVYKYPFGAEVTESGAEHSTPVDIVPWRSQADHIFAVYLVNNVLYLCGEDYNWTGYSNLRFLYVPEPAALILAMTTVLTYLPNAAEPALVAFLAFQMAKRGGAGEGQAKPDVSLFAAEWRAAEERLFDETGRRTQAVVSVIREAF